MKKAFCMLILVAWSCVFPPAPLAQQPGLVRGTVEGPSGNPVAEAAVNDFSIGPRYTFSFTTL